MNSILLLNSFLNNTNKFIMEHPAQHNINYILNKYKQYNSDIVNNFTIENTKNKIMNTIIKKETLDNDNEEDSGNRELKSLCTNIVITDIIENQDLYNFLYIVIITYQDILNKYIEKKNLHTDDIIFHYKGGDVFKIIGEQFWAYLPGKSSEYLIEQYKSYFKRSDSDFGIIINPNLDNFQTIFEEITYLNYEIQNLIMDILVHNEYICFTWFRYNNTFKQNILKKWLNKFNESDIFKDNNNSLYNNKIVNILFLDNSAIPTSEKYINSNNYLLDTVDKIKYKYNFTNKHKFSNITINKTLEWDWYNNYHSKFNLVRTKIVFNIIIKNNVTNKSTINRVAGELIDVSITHKDDSFMQDLYINKDKYITHIDWKFNDFNIYSNKIDTLNIKCFNLEYLYNDASKIVFETNIFPWSSPKYEKRLSRVYYFSIVDLFINLKNSNSTNIKLQYTKRILNYLSKFKFYINNILNKKFTKKNKIKLNLLIKHKEWFINYIYTLFNKSTDLLLVNTITKSLKCVTIILCKLNYINKIYDCSTSNIEINNDILYDLNNYLIIIYNNIHNLLITLENIKKYCNDDEIFNYTKFKK